mmetsp:Transcript_1843/g.4292  ORF Transcript_1843/g.4292 Transcript_1843/m.4292 type:complete len:242 (-) Transcript_1843:2056-2781(-)
MAACVASSSSVCGAFASLTSLACPSISSPAPLPPSALFFSVSASAKGFTICATLATSSSAFASFSAASCNDVARLRQSVSFLKTSSFVMAALMRSDSSPNSSNVFWAIASSKLRNSVVFVAMYSCALAIALSASSAAASDALTVSVASFNGSSSMPLRKGSSASVTFSIAASTLQVKSVASLANLWPNTCSRASFVTVLSVSIFCCPTLHRSKSFCRMALNAGMAAGICPSMVFITACKIP